MFIPDHFIPEFETAWKHLSQQKDSRLQDYVTHVGSLEGEVYYFNQIQPTMAIETTGQRLQKTVTDELETDRRAMFPRTISKACILDHNDPVFLGKCSISKSEVLQAHYMAHARKKDSIIIEAAYGTNYVGKNGGTPVEVDDSHVFANSVGGNTKMNIGKLLEATQLLEQEDVIGPDTLDSGDCKIILINARMKRELLEDDKVTSADYNTVRALVSGQLDSYLGYKFVTTEMLPTDENNNKVAIVYVKSGLRFGTWKGYETRVDELPDRNYAIQTWTQEIFGATRTEEKKFVFLPCANA